MAEASYNRLLTRLYTRSLDLRDPQLRRIFRHGIEGKRAFNRAYGAAVAAGFTATFQHFAAAPNLHGMAVAWAVRKSTASRHFHYTSTI